MKLATGIASIWARDAMTTANASLTLNEAYDGRFPPRSRGQPPHPDRVGPQARLLEAAVDHAHLPGADGRLDVPGGGPGPSPRTGCWPPWGPRCWPSRPSWPMGPHPYFVPVEHTVIAREAIGPDKLLAVEQMVVLEEDPSTAAREIARQHMGIYLGLPQLRRQPDPPRVRRGGDHRRLGPGGRRHRGLGIPRRRGGPRRRPPRRREPTTSASRSYLADDAGPSRSTSGGSWARPSVVTVDAGLVTWLVVGSPCCWPPWPSCSTG